MEDSDFIIKECPYCGQDRKIAKRYSKTLGRELEIGEDYLNGMTYRQIGRKYNICHVTVGVVIKKIGITPRPNKTSDVWGKHVQIPTEPLPEKYR